MTNALAIILVSLSKFGPWAAWAALAIGAAAARGATLGDPAGAGDVGAGGVGTFGPPVGVTPAGMLVCPDIGVVLPPATTPPIPRLAKASLMAVMSISGIVLLYHLMVR